jgi:uncharacterized protein
MTSPNQGAGLLCPACRVNLVMSERQGVEIDYCPQCRGVWLDRGELDKILERSAAEMPQRAQPQEFRPEYRDDDYKNHKHHKRRRSFLDDFFDD